MFSVTSSYGICRAAVLINNFLPSTFYIPRICLKAREVALNKQLNKMPAFLELTVWTGGDNLISGLLKTYVRLW